MEITATGGHSPAGKSGAPAPQSAAKTPDGAPRQGGPPDGTSVTVTLSVEARVIMASSTATAAASPAPASPYARYFPTRDGLPATALANGVSNPGGVSSSAGKRFDEVAKDARARMDARYKAMDDSGKPFDVNSFEGKDWNSLMGDLDRRSLYAVSSNEGGLFTKEEQDIAQSLMGQQQGLAMGLYNGPTSQAGTFSDPFGGDHAQQLKAGIRFLDAVSAEEKSSIPWAASRASAQASYEAVMEGRGEPAENLDSESPLVKLIKGAMGTMKNDPARGMTHGMLNTADDLKRQPWFKGFESQLDTLLAQPRKAEG